MKHINVKRIAAAALAVCATLTFAACGSGASGASSETSTLDSVLKAKTLKVGVVLSIPPAESKDKNGNPVGYDIDLANQLGESLGAKVEYVDMSADARISSLETGKVDVLFTQITQTLDRAQKVAFTDPYVASAPVIVTTKSSSISTAKDLSGKNVGILKGTTFDKLLDSTVSGANKQYFTDTASQTTALKNNQIDAFIYDGNSSYYMAKQDNDLKILDGAIGSLEYNGMAVKRGDQQWLNYLNQFVFQVISDGTNAKLYKKYYGLDMPFSPLLSESTGTSTTSQE
jgi:polar amino acid transport system substrate-binding protein